MIVLTNKLLVEKTYTISVNEQESVKIDCYISSIEMFKVLNSKWILNDSVPLAEKNISFILNKVQLNDSGVYECSAETDSSNYQTKIILIVNPKPVSKETRKKVLSAQKTKSILLDCTWWFTTSESFLFNTNVSYEIEWTRNGIKFGYNSAKYEFLDSFNTLLKINDLNINDSFDTFTCDFKLSKYKIKQSIFNLNIGVSPFVSEENLEFKQWFEKFEKVILECPINGQPAPKKSWYFNSNLIDATLSLVYHLNSDNSTLIIKKLEESLQGLYTCNASNEFGSEVYKHKVELACKI